MRAADLGSDRMGVGLTLVNVRFFSSIVRMTISPVAEAPSNTDRLAIFSCVVTFFRYQPWYVSSSKNLNTDVDDEGRAMILGSI